MKRFIQLLFVTICLIICTAGFSRCKKKDFLNTVPDNSLRIPVSFGDYRSLLDYDYVFNLANPALPDIGSDDYYQTSSQFQMLALVYQNEYTWASNPYPSVELMDWDLPYRAIYYANTVLSSIHNGGYDQGTDASWLGLKGEALFHRAHMMFLLSQVFSEPYDSSTSNSSLGIPIRLQADINEKIKRSSVQEVYNQIISDIHSAIPLLAQTAPYKTRPTTSAAYALAARVYLSMGDFLLARAYCDSCLNTTTAQFLDFKKLDTTAYFPIARNNSEVIFDCGVSRLYPSPINTLVNPVIDTGLYASYDKNDLRKPVLFKASFFATGNMFLGTYNGTQYPFSGIALDEIYLMQAECRARLGDVNGAMASLNSLLQTRWRLNTYVPFTATTPGDALKLILTERRKELLFRGIRWFDLRRLNKDPSYAKTLVRIVNGVSYSLSPKDLRYAWLIPTAVISANPGMAQNNR